MYKLINRCSDVRTTGVAYRHSNVYIFTEENIKVLSEACGFTKTEILKIFEKRPNLHQIEPVLIKDSILFCNKIGFAHKDLLRYPALLVSHPVKKFNQYQSLLDTGCKVIDPLLLSRATDYLKSKIERLKLDGYLDHEIDVADKLMEHIDPPIDKPEELCVELKTIDEKPWTEVHKSLLIPWLKVRLKATDEEITKLLRIHRMIKNKSFRIINENICLAESMGLSRDKILKCGFLLHNYPAYPKTMLKKYPYFAGIDIATVYKKNPKMMMANPYRFQEIYSLLKKYDITDDQIQHKPDVFILSPITLRERLEQIIKVPEFRPLLNHPGLLRIVVHHIKMTNRLDFLRMLKMRCASFKSIGMLKDNLFEHYIQEGKDSNSPPDVVIFFSRLLNKPKEDMKSKLVEHPYYSYVPYVDIDDTYQYLIGYGYKQDEIARVPLILLYRSDMVKEALETLKCEKNFEELSAFKQLNVLLYRIEKRFHFTGNGIWRTDLLACSDEFKQFE